MKNKSYPPFLTLSLWKTRHQYGDSQNTAPFTPSQGHGANFFLFHNKGKSGSAWEETGWAQTERREKQLPTPAPSTSQTRLHGRGSRQCLVSSLFKQNLASLVLVNSPPLMVLLHASGVRKINPRNKLHLHPRDFGLWLGDLMPSSKNKTLQNSFQTESPHLQQGSGMSKAGSPGHGWLVFIQRHYHSSAAFSTSFIRYLP